MLFPDKHIRLAESLIGLGSFVLDTLKTPKTVDDLWAEYQKINNTDRFPAYHTFENMILTVDFLFSIGAVDENPEGKLFRCAS